MLLDEKTIVERKQYGFWSFLEYPTSRLEEFTIGVKYRQRRNFQKKPFHIPKDLTGKPLREIKHDSIPLYPNYVSEATPEPYRQ